MIAISLVAVISVTALASGVATLRFVVRNRRAPNVQSRQWCRRLAVSDFILAAGGAVWFMFARDSADAPKLLIPVAALAVVGVLGWREAKALQSTVQTRRRAQRRRRAPTRGSEGLTEARCRSVG